MNTGRSQDGKPMRWEVASRSAYATPRATNGQTMRVACVSVARTFWSGVRLRKARALISCDTMISARNTRNAIRLTRMERTAKP